MNRIKNSLNNTRKRVAAGILAAVLLISILSVGLASTLASLGDITQTFDQPNNYQTLAFGETDEGFGGINNARSSNSSIATYSISGGNLTVTAKTQAGAVSISSATKMGQAYISNYQVYDPNGISGYTLANGGQITIAKNGSTNASGILTTKVNGTNNNTPKSSIKWSTHHTHVITVNEATGAVTAVQDAEGGAIVTGKITDKWGINRQIDVLILVGSISGGKEIIPGPDGGKYTEVDTDGNGNNQKDVYEKVDEDGNPVKPPEYLYDTDHDGDLNDRDHNGVQDAVMGNDGKFYTDNGDNTYTLIHPNGGLGGTVFPINPPSKPGNATDKNVITVDGTKYVDNGDGSYNKIGPTGNGKFHGTCPPDIHVWPKDKTKPIGPGNETETDPNAPVVTKVTLTASKTTFNPGDTALTLQATVTGTNLTIGTGNTAVTWSISPAGSTINQNGVFTPTAEGTYTVTVKSKEDATKTASITLKVNKPITNGQGTVAGGRLLSTAKSGDTSTWMEIATNGGYSLILRTKHLDAIATTFSLDKTYTAYAGQSHASGNIRYEVNDWYQNILSISAPLRNYTVGHDALEKPGTCLSLDNKSGFSVPTGAKPDSARDVAFPLSFQEAASYCSGKWNYWESYHNMVMSNESSAQAQANWATLVAQGNYKYNGWLRSPGRHGLDSNNYATLISKSYGGVVCGAVNGTHTVYPALWVDSSIFN